MNIHRRTRILTVTIAIFLLMAVTTACSFGDRGGTASVHQQLTEAEALWDAQGPSAYRIVVDGGGAWSPLRVVTTTVNGDEVTFDCTSDYEGGCDLVFETTNGITVPDLFDAVALYLENAQENSGEPCLTVQFEMDSYGYPSQIIQDCPDVFDDEIFYKVVEFEAVN